MIRINLLTTERKAAKAPALMTLTVGTSEVSGSFTIVRNIAKDEAPLRALTVNGVIISTIAEVTFYGHDQTGREVSVAANISVDFGNFGDKTS